MKKICVIGSLNMDLVVETERFPSPGETLTGSRFGTFPGGKGANQAVAAARLGADVLMAGKVGDDIYGEQYREVLRKNGVVGDSVITVKRCSTGIAVIEVTRRGENHIIIVPGANGTVDRSYINSVKKQLLDRDIFLLQLEIPLETVLFTAEFLRKNGKTIILDPAPARPIPPRLFPLIDYITPNESELAALTGMETDTEKNIIAAGKKLVINGCRTVIAKLGKRGAFLITRTSAVRVPGFRVKPLDTTAAGDSFNAGFAMALASGWPETECVCFANAVGALSTLKAGAQDGMPTMAMVKKFMK